jgi:hypothetical protein
MSAVNASIRANRAPTAFASRAKRAAWGAGRVVVLLATLAILLGLFRWPEATLSLLWNLLIPILPASFFITPQFWRGLCPLATVNQWVGGRFRQAHAGGKMLAAANLLGIVLLVVMVATRRLVFNEYGAVLAITILLVIVAAALLGALFSVRAGFCNAICPVLPVERLYGQHPLVRLDNQRCHPCTHCVVKGCLEVDQPKSILYAVRNSGGKYGWLATPYGILATSLPGFIVGYFTQNDVSWSAAGAVWDAVGVYLWIAGSSLVSCLAAMIVVRALRLDAVFSLTLLAAGAGALYYWWAAPLIVGALQLPPFAAWPLRGLIYLLLIVWLVRATANLPHRVLADNHNGHSCEGAVPRAGEV